MTRTSLVALAAVMLLAATGCGNRIVGHNLRQESSWYGELGITGHMNEVIVKSGSQLTKLSIVGDANRVTIEDRTTLAKIEIWGESNTISIPGHLVVRVNEWGKGTQIIRRSSEGFIRIEQPPTEPATESYIPPAAADEEPIAESTTEPAAEEPGTPVDPNTPE